MLVLNKPYLGNLLMSPYRGIALWLQELLLKFKRTYLEMSTRYYCIEWLLFVYCMHVCELHCYCSNNSELKSVTDPAAKYQYLEARHRYLLQNY